MYNLKYSIIKFTKVYIFETVYNESSLEEEVYLCDSDYLVTLQGQKYIYLGVIDNIKLYGI